MIVVPSQEAIELVRYYLGLGLNLELKNIAYIGRKKGIKKMLNLFHEMKFMDGDDWVCADVNSLSGYNRFVFSILYKGTQEQFLLELKNLPANRKKCSDKQAVNGFERILRKWPELINQNITVEKLRSDFKASNKMNFLSRLELTDEHLQKAKKKIIMIDVIEK